MNGWEYLDDDAYFLAEEEEAIVYQEPPKEWPCPYVPLGKKVLRYCPLSQVEAHRMIARTQNNDAIHCILFALSPNAYNMDASDVAQWVKECAAISRKRVVLHDTGKACPCGQTPRCKKSYTFSDAENSDIVQDMIERYQTLCGSLYIKLPGLDADKLSIVHAWAVERDPIQKGKAIRVSVLAKRFNCSTGTIYGAIKEARRINAYIIGKLEEKRKETIQITRGGTVTGQ
jgi:hypothetical protein